MRVIVLLLDNSFGPWRNIYLNGALKTWCVRDKFLIDFKTYRGNYPKYAHLNKLLNLIFVSSIGVKFWRFFPHKFPPLSLRCTELDDQIIVNCWEVWPNITIKTFAALNYIEKNYDYDYIIRANASCYINKKALASYLESNKDHLDYAGPIKSNFVAGWGIILSRKAVRVLIEKTTKKELKLFDDDSIGKVLSFFGIPAKPTPYIEIRHFEQLSRLSKLELVSTPFFRLKSSVNGKRIDDLLMQELHSISKVY